MKLSDLTGRRETATVTGFAIDHRKVAPGTVFGAFQGSRVNGEDFIGAAVAAGAIAVVTRPGVTVDGAVQLIDDNPRQLFAQLAAKFFAPFPPVTAAVTGTNGKTSTVELTRQLWRMAGHHAASIGTLGVTTADDSAVTGLTTPDVVTFLSNVAGLAREGVSHVAFEASSHGLSQYRTEGLKVSAAAFTNLSRDHLDYHGDMAAYFTAKLRLSPGMTVAEIGSGWGALAIYLAQACDVRVTAINVSPEQLAESRKRAQAAGVTDKVTFVAQDYRELSGQFDRVVSVGMMEHVGVSYFDDYFNSVQNLLAPGGFALVHAIGRMSPSFAPQPAFPRSAKSRGTIAP